MRLLTVVPARLKSTRLPNKPLRLLRGEPLIRRVVRNALGLGLPGDLVVASDDRRVLEAVTPLGVDTVLTDPDHRTGTERVGEVARGRPDAYDAIVNLQGDEPFLTAGVVRGAVEQVMRSRDIGTAAQPLGVDAADDPNRVKVAVDGAGRACRFFRRHDTRPPCPETAEAAIFQHVGIYAFTRHALERWLTLPHVPAERTERLEQLRPLEAGMTIGVAVLADPVPPGIDTEEDLQMAEETR